MHHMNQAIRHYFKKENMCVCLIGNIPCSHEMIQRECEKL